MNVSRLLPALFAAAVLSAACAGCMSPVTSGIAVEKGVLEFENDFFSSRIAASEDRTMKVAGDFLKAQVTVKNTGTRDLTFQYCFVWKDQYGTTITSAPTPWCSLVLHGREERVLQAVCPVAGAADFRLALRP